MDSGDTGMDTDQEFKSGSAGAENSLAGTSLSNIFKTTENLSSLEERAAFALKNSTSALLVEAVEDGNTKVVDMILRHDKQLFQATDQGLSKQAEEIRIPRNLIVKMTERALEHEHYTVTKTILDLAEKRFCSDEFSWMAQFLVKKIANGDTPDDAIICLKKVATRLEDALGLDAYVSTLHQVADAEKPQHIAKHFMTYYTWKQAKENYFGHDTKTLKKKAAENDAYLRAHQDEISHRRQINSLRLVK